MDIEDVTPGTVVMIVDMSLNCGSPADISIPVSNPNTPFGRLAVVVAVQDPESHPGKWIALCLREEWEYAHECDGLVPMKHGWWSRPEYLYTSEERDLHEASSESWRQQRKAAQAVVAAFMASSGIQPPLGSEE